MINLSKWNISKMTNVNGLYNCVEVLSLNSLINDNFSKRKKSIKSCLWSAVQSWIWLGNFEQRVSAF